MSIIFTFPPELKVRLFSPFTLYELLQMRLVSRQWRILMEEVGSFKTELGIVSQYSAENTAFNSVKLNGRRFDDEPPLLSPNGAHFISAIFPNITKATFDLNEAEYSLPNYSKLNFSVEELLRDWAPNLTCLDFNFQYLKSVKLDKVKFVVIINKRNQLLAIISSLPALTQLHLTDMQNIRLPEPFPVLSRLEELKLKRYYSIEHLVNVFRQVSPSLTLLAVDSLPDVLPESTIAKLSSSLTKLTIYDMAVRNGASFFATLRRLHGLTVLDLCAVSNFNELHFSDLMTALVDLPQLHTVSLNTCLLSYKTDPPYSFPAHPAVRQLYIKSDDYERIVHSYDGEMQKLSVFAYAFPNVNKVTIAAYDVHKVRRFLRIDDDHHQTLENYVKGHFGEQTEVKLKNTGHWDSDEEDDEDDEDEEVEEDEIDSDYSDSDNE